MGITHAVDATNFPECLRISGIEYFGVEIDDSEIADLKKYFEPAARFIRNAREEGGKILVYCAAGISRSSSIVIIYLMICEGLTLRQAYCEVSRSRPIIAPNLGFWRQMIEYEKEKFGGSTVTLLNGMRKPIPNVYINKTKPVDEVKWRMFCEKYPDAEDQFFRS
uniref:Protein-tyrosine-phosphatase n=1 Tax=Acrobeloides nanus TaxID=290746 RepID=A0A914CYS7_9BILA